MFNSINTISGISSKLGNFARTARSKTVLAAAVAATGMGLASTSFAAPTTPQVVTSITTSLTTGSLSSAGTLSAAGTSNVSKFYPDTNTYPVQYENNVSKITKLTAGGTVYVQTGQGTAVVRTSNGSPYETIWVDGNGTGANHSTITLQGTQAATNLSADKAINGVLGGNNVLQGADNVFSNMGNSVGDNTNIVRVDILYTGGLKTSTNSAFSIFDRGANNDHDSFKIAAITAIDSSGNPSNYGQLISFNDGQWGTTNVIGPTQEDILRKDDRVPNGSFHPSDSTGQTVGGELIPTSYLASAGTTIYGYSLFSGVANGSGTQLVGWTNSSFFPSADSTSTGGGLDPVGTLGALYTTTAVPEPATASLLILGAGGLIARRPSKRKLA